MFLFSLIPLAAAADLALENVHYNVFVAGSTADVVVEQTFHNDTDHTVAATYTFPLSEGVTVDRLHITIGSRVIDGVIKENGVADRMYAEARAAGREAPPVHTDRKRFRQHIANIGAGETIEVTLGLIVPVGVPDSGAGAHELGLPQTVRTRLIEDDWLPSLDAPEGDSAPPQVVIDVDVHAAVPVVRAEGPTDATLVIHGEHLTASVPDPPSGTDFVLRWWTAGATPAIGMLVAREHAMLTITAPSTSSYAERVPREMVWVLDTSWGMHDRLDLAKQAMNAALDQMDRRDSFEIYTVDGRVRRAFRKPLDGRRGHIRRAHRVMDTLQVGGDSTLGGALLAALALPTDPARHRVVCMLTSTGEFPSSDVLAAIAAHPEITIMTVSFDGADDRLDSLAVLGGGAGVHITWGEAPEVAVPRLVAAMDRPILTELSVDWGDWKMESAYPARVPDLRVGDEEFVAAHVPGGSGSVRVSGRTGTGSFTEVVTPVQVPDDRPLVTTWAGRKIGDVQRRRAVGQLADERPEILETAVRWQIDTNYTERVAVEASDGDEVASEAPSPGDFLPRTPSGRFYNRGVYEPGGPFDGAYSLNFNFDAASGLPSAGDHGRVPTLGGPMLSADLDEILWPRNLLNGTAVASSTLGRAAYSFDLWGEAGGKVMIDKLWAASLIEVRTAGQAEVQSASTSLDLRLVAQPSSKHRLTLDLDTDPTYAMAAGATSRYGGERGTLRWNWFVSPFASATTQVTAEQRTVRGDQREGVEVLSAFQVLGLRAAGRHDLYTTASLEHFAWLGRAGEGAATLGVVFLRDRWNYYGRVQVDATLAGGLLVSDHAHFLPSPGLLIRWAPFGTYNTRLRVAGSRNWDAGSLAVGALDDAGLPGRVDSATLALDQGLLSDFALCVEVTGRLEHTAFVPRPDWVEVDAVPGSPWVDRTLGQLDVSLSREFFSRWEAGVTWRERLPGTPDPALLSDPRAFWVAGFLDAYRRHNIDWYVTFDVPDAPATTTLGAQGSWAASADPTTEPSTTAWWLEPRTRIALWLRQRVPLRKGSLDVDIHGTWSLRDLNQTFLPLPVLATEPSAPTLDEQPPLSGYVAIHAEF